MLVLAVNERDIGPHTPEFVYTELGQRRQGDIGRESRDIEVGLRAIVAGVWSCGRVVSEVSWAGDCAVVSG